MTAVTAHHITIQIVAAAAQTSDNVLVDIHGIRCWGRRGMRGERRGIEEREGERERVGISMKQIIIDRALITGGVI